MNALIAFLIVIAAFLFMEFVAWFTHKYVMHGFMWYFHKDHHIRDGRKVERNDFFALMFAVPSIWLIYLGFPGMDYRFWIGFGIALYGLAYFLFHDVMVHQRVKILGNISNRYLKATIRAHMDHHKPHTHSNYGFLVAPWRYYKEEYSNKPQEQA
ncbi:MAG: sterol desaturase family protein [Lentimicrobiaceae bacterium]|nr:sterol desaturase family protein [Lentimicrobiaceae bacterium]